MSAASPLLEPRERRDHWKVRRKVLFATILFSMLVIAYVLVARGAEDRVAETALTMAFLTIVSCVGSYVFGAAWEDIAVATKIVQQRRDG